jgi:hypothetical protein
MDEVMKVAGFSRVETPCQIDPDLFYSEIGRDKLKAKSICGTCDVRDRCFNQAKDAQERFGIWGGVDFSVEETRDPNKCRKQIHRLPRDRTNNRCEKCAKEYKKAYNARPDVAAARLESNRKGSLAKKNRIGGHCRSGKHLLTKENTELKIDGRSPNGTLSCLQCLQGPQKVRFRNDKGVRDGYGFGTSQ